MTNKCEHEQGGETHIECIKCGKFIQWCALCDYEVATSDFKSCLDTWIKHTTSNNHMSNVMKEMLGELP